MIRDQVSFICVCVHFLSKKISSIKFDSLFHKMNKKKNEPTESADSWSKYRRVRKYQVTKEEWQGRCEGHDRSCNEMELLYNKSVIRDTGNVYGDRDGCLYRLRMSLRVLYLHLPPLLYSKHTWYNSDSLQGSEDSKCPESGKVA